MRGAWHTGGQVTHVYRLVTKGTVEQRMVERAQKKLFLDTMVNRGGNKVRCDENPDTGDDILIMDACQDGVRAVVG